MSSFTGDLRFLRRQKTDGKAKKQRQFFAHSDELDRAVQDMQDTKECYDRLLSVASAAASSAYEFSQTLRELGACLLEKNALNEDEESGRVILMLGKVQFQLHKIMDVYRSHIFTTIITPSESLLNELLKVEEMKRVCDEKRSAYEKMKAAAQENENVRSRGPKRTEAELQRMWDEYDEACTQCIFRLESLKQGRSRSVLTLAARHHDAQLNLFTKGFSFLDAIEPHVGTIAHSNKISAFPQTPARDADAPITVGSDENRIGMGGDRLSPPRLLLSYALPTPSDAKTSVGGGGGRVSSSSLASPPRSCFHELPKPPLKASAAARYHSVPLLSYPPLQSHHPSRPFAPTTHGLALPFSHRQYFTC